MSGTIADFIVNVWTISPHADADALSLRVLTEVNNINMRRLLPIIDFASNISNYVGGSGNAIGPLTLMAPLYTTYGAIAFYLPAIPTLMLISHIGRKYYEAFNIKHLLNTLKVLEDFFSARKEHIDHDWSRELMIGVITAFVVAFRSIGFGGIAVLVLERLIIENAWAHAIFGLGAVIFTAVQILATRWYRINAAWCNNDFALLYLSEKEAAWHGLKWWNDIIKGCVLTADTFESLVMAGSAPLFMMDSKASFSEAFSKAFSNNITYILLLVGLAYVLNTCLAKVRLAINNKALEKISGNDINIRDRKNKQHDIETGAGNDEAHNPLVQTLSLPQEQNEPPALSADELMHINITGVQKIFATLDKAYLATWTVFLTAGLFCAYAVLTRGLGFLEYVNKTNSMIKVMAVIDAHAYQVIGLGLLLGPPNMHNMFDMFYANMSEYMARKASEAEMTYHNERLDDHQSFSNWASSNKSFFVNPIKGWAFSNIPGSEWIRSKISFFDNYTGESLYTKGGLTYTAGEVRKHLNDKIVDLEAQLPDQNAQFVFN